MAQLDLSGLTTAQLETMRDNLLSAHARSTSSEAYTIGARNLKRASLKDILENLSDVTAELAARADSTGGIGLVEFDEQFDARDSERLC